MAAHAHVALATVPMTIEAITPAIAMAGHEAIAAVHAVMPAVAMVIDDIADLPARILGDVAFEPTEPLPPESWAPQDPADTLWRTARRALNDGDYARAAQLYNRIHDDARYRGSEYRAASMYWEAFARQRMGGRTELQRARSSLTEMRRLYADAYKQQKDAPSLLTRIEADLARLGDARAGEVIASRSKSVTQNPCNDPNMAVKVETLNALLQMDAENAMPILEEVMKKKDACSVELRRRAVFMIAQKPTPRTSEMLLDAVRDDPDPQVQENAVFWLSQVNSDAAVDALQNILSHSDNKKLQERALFAVSQHHSERAGEILRSYVMRPDVSGDLRGNAIFFMSQRPGANNERVLRELYPKLDSKDAKAKVMFAMGQLPGSTAGDWLFDRAMDSNEDVEVRKNALFWAGQKKSIPLERLTTLYDRMPSTEMKDQIIFTLSQRTEERAAVDKLMDIAKNEKDPALRKRAIFWLGQSKDPRVGKFLLEMIKN